MPIACVGAGPCGSRGSGRLRSMSRANRRSRSTGSKRHAIAPSAQCGPDQAVGLGVSAAPPALAQVGADLPGGGSVELAIDVGLDLRAQSKVTEMVHALGTRGPRR